MEYKWVNIIFVTMWLAGLFRCISLIKADEEPDWEKIFLTRSDEDWRSMWHSEKHRRCFEAVDVHMRWACDKDIYDISLPDKRKMEIPKRFEEDGFLPIERAYSFGIKQFRSRRNRLKRELDKPGIYQECCQPGDGCSWEEYAEYCSNNTRIRN